MVVRPVERQRMGLRPRRPQLLANVPVPRVEIEIGRIRAGHALDHLEPDVVGRRVFHQATAWPAHHQRLAAGGKPRMPGRIHLRHQQRRQSVRNQHRRRRRGAGGDHPHLRMRRPLTLVPIHLVGPQHAHQTGMLPVNLQRPGIVHRALDGKHPVVLRSGHVHRVGRFVQPRLHGRNDALVAVHLRPIGVRRQQPAADVGPEHLHLRLEHLHHLDAVRLNLGLVGSFLVVLQHEHPRHPLGVDLLLVVNPHAADDV